MKTPTNTGQHQTPTAEYRDKGRATGYTIAGASVVRVHLAKPYNQRIPVGYCSEFLDAYVPNESLGLSQQRYVKRYSFKPDF